MDQDYNFALPTELNGTVNIPGAGARNIAPGTNSQRQNYDYTRTAIADQQATTESGTHVVEVPISSIAAGRDENYSEVDQVNTVTVVKQQVSDSGSQIASPCADVAHNTNKTQLEPRLPRCNSCGFGCLPDEEEPMLEQHAKYDVNCPSIQDDIKAQFIDIQSRKQEMCGENFEHLRLKEWLLCKACSQSHSTIVLKPCHHLCLCQICAETESCCPTCSGAIEHKIRVELGTEIPKSARNN